jgi:hypothetical protein
MMTLVYRKKNTSINTDGSTSTQWFRWNKSLQIFRGVDKRTKASRHDRLTPLFRGHVEDIFHQLFPRIVQISAPGELKARVLEDHGAHHQDPRNGAELLGHRNEVGRVLTPNVTKITVIDSSKYIVWAVLGIVSDTNTARNSRNVALGGDAYGLGLGSGVTTGKYRYPVHPRSRRKHHCPPKRATRSRMQI